MGEVKNKFQLLLLFIVIGLTSSACGLGKSQSLFVGSQAGFQAFQAQVYPVLKQRCGTCHTTVQSPNFSHNNPSTAYAAAIGEIDLTDPSKSDLLEMTTSNHNGCQPAGTCQTDYDALEPVLYTWANVELSSGGSYPGITFAAKPVPTGLSDTTFTTLTWNLEDQLGTAFAGVTISFDVKYFDSTHTIYEVADPKITIPPGIGPISIKNVRVIYNAIIGGSQTTWNYVDGTFASPGATLATTHHLFSQALGEGLDTMGLNVEEITIP